MEYPVLQLPCLESFIRRVLSGCSTGNRIIGMASEKDYMEVLRERSKKSHIYKKYQMVGLMLAEILHDDAHKALYMKLAKKHDHDKLVDITRSVADKINVKNKGAYFMSVLFGKEPETRKKNPIKKQQ